MKLLLLISAFFIFTNSNHAHLGNKILDQMVQINFDKYIEQGNFFGAIRFLRYQDKLEDFCHKTDIDEIKNLKDKMNFWKILSCAGFNDLAKDQANKLGMLVWVKKQIEEVKLEQKQEEILKLLHASCEVIKKTNRGRKLFELSNIDNNKETIDSFENLEMAQLFKILNNPNDYNEADLDELMKNICKQSKNKKFDVFTFLIDEKKINPANLFKKSWVKQIFFDKSLNYDEKDKWIRFFHEHINSNSGFEYAKKINIKRLNFHGKKQYIQCLYDNQYHELLEKKAKQVKFDSLVENKNSDENKVIWVKLLYTLKFDHCLTESVSEVDISKIRNQTGWINFLYNSNYKDELPFIFSQIPKRKFPKLVKMFNFLGIKNVKLNNFSK